MYSFITDGNFVIFKYTEDHFPNYEHEVFKLHNTSKCIDWVLPEDTTLITFTIDETRYENVPLSSIDFDGEVCGVQQDFIDGLQSMFENLAGGGQEGGGLGYLVYTALLTQSGTSAPAATVFENTIGDIIWTRSDVGFYLGTLTNAFPEEKTWTYIEQTDNHSNTGKITMHQDNNDRVYIDTYDATGTLADGKMTFTSIEIRVYP